MPHLDVPPGFGPTDYFRGTCFGTRIDITHQKCSQECNSCANELVGASTIGDCIQVSPTQWIKLEGVCANNAVSLSLAIFTLIFALLIFDIYY